MKQDLTRSSDPVVEKPGDALVYKANRKVEKEKDSEDGCHQKQQHPLHHFGAAYPLNDYFGDFLLRHQLNLHPNESDYERVLCHGRGLMNNHHYSDLYRIRLLHVKQPIDVAYR